MFKTLKTLSVALSLAFVPVAAQAQEVVLRLHQFLPQTSVIPAEGLKPWADAVTEASNGEIVIEHYPSMTLGGTPPQLFDQAKDGVVDIIWTVLGYTPGRFPKSEVFELPFMVADAQSTSVAFQEYVEQHAMNEFAQVHLLAVHTHGPGLFHVKNPINTLEDLDGMKVRGGSRIINEMLSNLGAEPIGMPVPQVPESLASGIIEGATIPWEVTSALHTSQMVQNHTGFSGERGLYTQTFAVVMNKFSYERLSEEHRAIIDAHSGADFAAALGAAMDQGDIDGRKIAEHLGNTIITLDAAETERWKQRAQAIIDRWVNDTPDGETLYQAAQFLVQEQTAN